MKNKQMTIGALLSYFSIGLNIVCGLLYTPWMVQQIGQSQYGLYTLANSLITLLMVDFGLSMATSRYVSKYRAEGDQQKINDFLGAVYKLYLMITAVIFLILTVLYLFIDVIYAQLTPEEIRQFKVVYLISASFAVINFPFITFNGILTSYEKFIQLKLADVLYRVGLVVSTVVALLLGYGLYALVGLHAVVGLLVTLYKYIVIKKTIPVRVNFKKRSTGLYREIFSFSIWVTLSALAQRLIFNVTPSILGIVTSSGAAAIAIFGVVTTLESYIYTIITALSNMFMPRVSRIIVEDESRLAPFMLKVGRFQYALNGLILVGFAVVGREFITLWMGPEYIQAYWGLLLVLIPGTFYNSLQIANITMIAIKKVNIEAAVVVTSGVINLLLSIPFSYLWGTVGACASIFVAYIVRAVVLNIIYSRMPQFKMGQFFKQCYIRISCPILVAIVLSMGLTPLISGSGWGAFLLKSALTAVIYVLLLALTGLSREEQKRLLSEMRSKLKR